MTCVEPSTGERNAVALKPPISQEDWHAKRRAVDTVLDDLGGVVIRVGDETSGEMWSLADGEDVLNEVDPRFAANIRRRIQSAVQADPFHVSANTDPKGDRSKAPQEQDPDMLLHVVRETGSGIVVRGAKYETAAAHANQALAKPTIANWGNDELSDYAVGFIVDMGAPGIKHLCRTGFAGRAPAADYPLASRFDETDGGRRVQRGARRVGRRAVGGCRGGGADPAGPSPRIASSSRRSGSRWSSVDRVTWSTRTSPTSSWRWSSSGVPRRSSSGSPGRSHPLIAVGRNVPGVRARSMAWMKTRSGVLGMIAAGVLLAAAPSSHASSRWPGTRVTYADATTKPRLIAEAVRRWNAATGLRLVPARGSRAQIRILPAANTLCGPEPCGFYPPDGRVYLGRSWRSGPRSFPDDPLADTGQLIFAVHEIGHALGLDHVSTGCSIMYHYVDLGQRGCRPLRNVGSGVYGCGPYPADARRLARLYGVRAKRPVRCTLPAVPAALLDPGTTITARERDLGTANPAGTVPVRVRNTGTRTWGAGPLHVSFAPVDAAGRSGSPCTALASLYPSDQRVRRGEVTTVRLPVCGTGVNVYRLRLEASFPAGLGSGPLLTIRVGIDHAPGADGYVLSRETMVDAGGTSVAFAATDVTDDHDGLRLVWDFGDPASGAANASTEAEPQHRYGTPGTYEARLTATDSSGQSREYATTVTVLPYEPPSTG